MYSNAKGYYATKNRAEITEEDSNFCYFGRQPAKVSKKATAQFILVESKELPPIMAECFNLLREQGWQFYFADQSRGTCYFNRRVIVYPLWIKARELAYQHWYIAHELAHAFAGSRAKHGPVFMEELKAICPITSRHYELNYKPANAKAAGISEFDAIPDSDL